MKRLVMFATVAGLLATPVAANAEASDLEYVRASRCKGLAMELAGAGGQTALDAFLVAQGRSRSPYIQELAGAEFRRARKEARSEERRDRHLRELAGICQSLAHASLGVAAPRFGKPAPVAAASVRSTACPPEKARNSYMLMFQ